jgi:predicted ATP-dependent Lon-type protease
VVIKDDFEFLIHIHRLEIWALEQQLAHAVGKFVACKAAFVCEQQRKRIVLADFSVGEVVACVVNVGVSFQVANTANARSRIKREL